MPKMFLEILFHRTKSYFGAPRKTLNKIGVMFHLYLTFVYHIKKVSCENIVREKFVLRKTLSDPNVSSRVLEKPFNILLRRATFSQIARRVIWENVVAQL